MVTIHKLLTRHCTFCHHELVLLMHSLRYNQVDWASVIVILDTACSRWGSNQERGTWLQDWCIISILKVYQVDWVLLGLSAMDELVNQMVQPSGATWQLVLCMAAQKIQSINHFKHLCYRFLNMLARHGTLILRGVSSSRNLSSVFVWNGFVEHSIIPQTLPGHHHHLCCTILKWPSLVDRCKFRIIQTVILHQRICI